MSAFVCAQRRLLTRRPAFGLANSGVRRSAQLFDVAASLPRPVVRPSGFWRALRWYKANLDARPLVTKCATGCLLFGMGDLAAQWAKNFSAPKPHAATDVVRASRMALWGGPFNAGLGHFWYNAVEALATLPGPLGVVQRIAYDQLFWTPLLTAVFFGYHSLVSGSGLVGLKQDLLSKYWPTMRENWKVWPLVHVVTYALVPLQLRVVWVSLAGVCWSTFLSFIVNDFQA